MKEVSRLVTEDGQQKLVVLSAMSGTTNSLVEIAQYLYGGNKTGADDVINRLRAKYYAHVPELLERRIRMNSRSSWRRSSTISSHSTLTVFQKRKRR